MRIQRAFTELKRTTQDFDVLWNGNDGGLIAAWERGREKAIEDSVLANKVIQGQLVVLPWKGGVEKAIKAMVKFGTFHYLAMWQGLHGMDLDIDPSEEITKTCSRTGVVVTFTSDVKKFCQAQGE